MKLHIYAVTDNKAQALVRFAFGSNNTSFIRDNLPNDIYNRETRRGIPYDDLTYYDIGEVDTETYKGSFYDSPVEVDKEHSYKFKTENSVENKE